MSTLPVIALLDIGKTNKKLFLLDTSYQVVHEYSERFPEVTDEDGDPCEDLRALQTFVVHALSSLSENNAWDICAVQFSAYGASLVYLNEQGQPLTPLYNYLKPYPKSLSREFYETYGDAEQIAAATASPVLGSLNSGMQFYRLRKQQPERFKQVRHALHLPQYLSWLITGQAVSELTSIGCHTQLWDFSQNTYHRWVQQEHLQERLAPIIPSNNVFPARNLPLQCPVGVGLHDSSAALIPYLASFQEPFILLSTGTWCIALNPFNSSPLTREELQLDCLCYMDYQGNPVKASRLFAGHEHEQQARRIADHFQVSVDTLTTMPFNPQMALRSSLATPQAKDPIQGLKLFQQRPLNEFRSAEEAYHQLILDLVCAQYHALHRVLQQSPVRQIFVDGGFSQNQIFMTLLASVFPEIEVSAASIPQATSIGAALAIHSHWNPLPIPQNLVSCKRYYASLS